MAIYLARLKRGIGVGIAVKPEDITVTVFETAGADGVSE